MFRPDVSRRRGTTRDTARTCAAAGAAPAAERHVGERLRMRQRMFALTDAFWVEADSGQRAWSTSVCWTK